MKHIFDLNSPIMAFLARIMDLMILSLLWIVCSIPLITIGPATAALYYVTLKMVKNEDAKIAISYLRSFKDNFKQGIVFSVILIFGGSVLLLDYWYVFVLKESVGMLPGIVFSFLMIVFFSVMCYTFPLQAQFANTIYCTLKNAFLLALQNIGKTVIIVALNSMPLVVAFTSFELFLRTIPLWIMLAPASIAYISSFRFDKIFSPLIENAMKQEEHIVQQ